MAVAIESKELSEAGLTKAETFKNGLLEIFDGDSSFEEFQNFLKDRQESSLLNFALQEAIRRNKIKELEYLVKTLRVSVNCLVKSSANDDSVKSDHVPGLKQALSRLIYSRAVFCIESAEGNLEFVFHEKEETEKNEYEFSRLKWSLKFALEDEDWDWAEQIISEMAMEEPVKHSNAFSIYQLVIGLSRNYYKPLPFLGELDHVKQTRKKTNGQGLGLNYNLMGEEVSPFLKKYLKDVEEARNSGRTYHLRPSYEFLSRNFDRQHWARVAHELDNFSKTTDETLYLTKRKQVSRLIFKGIIRCKELGGRLEFIGQATADSESHSEIEMDRKIRLKFSLQYAMEGRDWNFVLQLLLEMTTNAPVKSEIIYYSVGVDSLLDVILKFSEFHFLLKHKKKEKHEILEITQKSIAQDLICDKKHLAEKDFSVSLPKQEAQESIKDNEDLPFQERYKINKLKVISWHYICLVLELEAGLPYLKTQARAVGIKVEDINKIQSREFLSALRSMDSSSERFSYERAYMATLRLMRAECVPAWLLEEWGWRPLGFAVKQGDLNKIRYLAAAGFNINADEEIPISSSSDSNEITVGSALTIAFSSECQDRAPVVSTLIQLGALSNIKQMDMTPLCIALFDRDFLTANALLEALDISSTINEACKGEAFSFFNNSSDLYFGQYSPLMIAVSFCRPTVIRKMISLGADVSFRGSGHEGNVLIEAINERAFETEADFEVVQILIAAFKKAGISLNDKDRRGNTALMAASIKNEKILTLLLKAGASFVDKDRRGMTALMKACECGNLKSVQVLLDFGAGATLHEKSKAGRSALKIASMAGRSEIVKILRRQESLVSIGNQSSASDRDSKELRESDAIFGEVGAENISGSDPKKEITLGNAYTPAYSSLRECEEYFPKREIDKSKDPQRQLLCM